MQKTTIRAIVHPLMIKAVSDALLENDEDMAPVATFVSNYVQKEPKSRQERRNFFGSKKKIRELLPSPPTLEASDDYEIPSRKKKNGALVVARRAQRNQACLLALLMMMCGV